MVMLYVQHEQQIEFRCDSQSATAFNYMLFIRPSESAWNRDKASRVDGYWYDHLKNQRFETLCIVF